PIKKPCDISTTSARRCGTREEDTSRIVQGQRSKRGMAGDFSGDQGHTDGDTSSGGNFARRLSDAAREDHDSTSWAVADGASRGAGVWRDECAPGPGTQQLESMVGVNSWRKERD